MEQEPSRQKPRRKNQPTRRSYPSRFPSHLLLMAVVLRQLAANLTPPYQAAARSKTPIKVSTTWNARPKTRGLLEFRGRTHQTHQALFFSPIFSLAREKIGRRRVKNRPRRNESPLFAEPLSSLSRFFLQNRKLNLRFWVFIANLLQPLSLGFAEPASLPLFVPAGHFPPDRGNRPLGRGSFYTYAAAVRCGGWRLGRRGWLG